MSIFQAASSASLIGWPKCGLSGKGCTGCGPVLPSGIPFDDFAVIPPPISAQPHRALVIKTKISLRLADRIAHLAFAVDRPALNPVMFLHEPSDPPRLPSFLPPGLP